MTDWRKVILTMEPTAKPWIVDGLVDAMPSIIERYKIDTTLRQQHFLATLAHESDHFHTTTEYASGAAYENRKDLGNTHRGDGKKFKGRGLIQLTGRSNYQAASDEFKQDFVEDPELAARFPWAALTGGWFWHKNGLNAVADKDDCRGVCKIVNGGYNGIDSRTMLTQLAGKALA